MYCFALTISLNSLEGVNRLIISMLLIILAVLGNRNRTRGGFCSCKQICDKSNYNNNILINYVIIGVYSGGLRSELQQCYRLS
jgi:hypothetical protein